MKADPAPPHSGFHFSAFGIVTALVFPIVLGVAMTKGLNHDEHQHIAAGALLAREGLLPYMDFPHFHTPYLAFIYAALFRVTDHLLLAARLFSAVCASTMVGLVGSAGYALLRGRGRTIAGGVCAGAVVLCLTAGLFGQTVGRAWNQEPALLFALLAFFAHVVGIERERNRWLIASGALLGLAIGTRLTYAPLVAPFGLALVLYPSPRWQPRTILTFAGGLLIGSGGFLFFLAAAPEQTFFGTFEFARVNIAYRFSAGEPRTMTVLTKLRYLFKVIARHEVPLIASALLPLIAAHLAARGQGRPRRFELRFILLLLPFLLFGSLAPSPLFRQYFFPFVPFLILAGLYALTSVPPETRLFRATLSLGVLAAVCSVVLGFQPYSHPADWLFAADWKPFKVQREAAILRAHVPSGRVLTLGPILPLEAGLPIYPPFATGPFAWRIASHVEAAKAARLGLVTPASLTADLDARPPAAVLLGFERTEADFETYAKSRGYRSEPLGDLVLWIAPEPRPLGAK